MPYSVIVKVQLVGRSGGDFMDDVFSCISSIYFEIPYDREGNYRVLEALAPPYGGLGSWEWIDAPNLYLPPFERVDVIRMTGSAIGYHTASMIRPPPPYLDNLLRYWEKEKVALSGLDIEPELTRDCTLEALDEASFSDSLSFENLKDLIEVADTIKGAVSLVGDFRSAIRKLDPLKLLKVVASVHLIWRYVIKTTARDLTELRALAWNIWMHRDLWWDYLTIARGRSKELTYSSSGRRSMRLYNCVVNLRFDVRPAQYHLVEYTRRVGLSPTLVGFWDLVPFSFVVDWVLPIGDTIEAWEVLNDLKYLSFLSVMTKKSYRTVTEDIYPGLLLRGRSQRFKRVVSNTYQGSSAVPGFRLKNPIKQFWTAGALVIAMIKSR